jgi:hypothetical protein
MAQLSKEKTEKPIQAAPVATAAEPPEAAIAESGVAPAAAIPAPSAANQDIDEILNSLKTLLSAVEKLQKVRQEVGDIKPLLMRMLDGELIAGEDLEQLKVGVGGLIRLVKAHGDHQVILTKAQAARSLLDQVLKTTSPKELE